MNHIKQKTKLTAYIVIGVAVGMFIAWGISVGAATVQNITGSDTIADFPSVFNTTVNNLNADKLDTASSTDDLTEGNSNLYWTTVRGTENFVSNLSATSSVDSITALDNLTTASSLVTVGTLTTGSTGAGFTVNLDSSTLTCGSCIDISSHTNLIGGTNITLSGDTLNVDDAFLINSGDDITTGSITATEFIGSDANATSSFSGGLTVDQSVVVSGNFEASSVKSGNGIATTTINGTGVTFPDGSVQTAAASGGGGGLAFGSGTDGSATISSNSTTTEDKFYEDLTIESGVTFCTCGYRIYVSGTLEVNGTIHNNGQAGGNGDNGDADTGTTPQGGAAGIVASGYLDASSSGAGANGQNGLTNGTAGSAGTSENPSMGVDGSSGGSGGNDNQNGGTGGSGGSAGTATLENVDFQSQSTTTISRISAGTNTFGAAYQIVGATSMASTSPTAGSGGGGSGASGGNDSEGGAGGGGGAPGGNLEIAASAINISASGVISANGGNGGNGGNGFQGQANQPGAGGGGGGGGSGGVVMLIYTSLSNNGSISVAGGSGGTGGTASGNGTAGASGGAGTTGKIYQVLVE